MWQEGGSNEELESSLLATMPEYQQAAGYISDNEASYSSDEGRQEAVHHLSANPHTQKHVFEPDPVPNIATWDPSYVLKTISKNHPENSAELKNCIRICRFLPNDAENADPEGESLPEPHPEEEIWHTMAPNICSTVDLHPNAVKHAIPQQQYGMKERTTRSIMWHWKRRCFV